jgi:hypothetical protein
MDQGRDECGARENRKEDARIKPWQFSTRIALRDTNVFTATGWFPGWRVGVHVERLDLRLPMQSHSGIIQILNLAYRCGGSAGLAVPAERRTGFPFKSANDHLQIPEADYRRSIGLRLRNCKTIMPSCAGR